MLMTRLLQFDRNLRVAGFPSISEYASYSLHLKHKFITKPGLCRGVFWFKAKD